MAFSSLFTLLDDIASVLDDVSVMTKVAAKKTVGLISDDLALNANQVSGKDIGAERELPVVFSVARGSLINKVILIPLALLLSVYFPSAINILLMAGGAYLCFEGVEKLLHKFIHQEQHEEIKDSSDEKDKIKGAVRTDFILSAEIIIIALGSIQQADISTKILTLSAVGLGITVFVYGLVGLIVKLDDIGLWLLRKNGKFSQKSGEFLLFIMPWFMRSLSVIGTIAMFLVGGGIFVHYLPEIHHFVEQFRIYHQLAWLVEGLTGMIIGAIACAVILPLLKLFSRKAH
ncbi:DUF808 domain-containing protein [Basfia succiniciproducens]|uniref:DUF808 domain-containing protein n=1 Tax=Basfia succiniciproducens TaxID=653940 RepID=A0A1G5BQI6_9PAST|nr:DUF808 domain-containing protein [Basfia succiniciproducens]QIM68333.1 hypothetical protein A4G13_02445 [Basfia succiniciproducens]SCX92337.1 hypothetical protein SAMN02910354_00849 [Basfia succiniciproducens]